MTIDTALSRYLLQLQANGRSPHTIGQARRHGHLLIRWLRAQRHRGDVRRITPTYLARFLTSDLAIHRPDGTPKKASAMNALRSSLRGLFRHLHEAGQVPADPARLIRNARCGRPLPRSLSRDDEKALLTTLKAAGKKCPVASRDHLLAHLLLATGLRISSALALRVQDIDLEDRVIHVHVAKNARPVTVFFGATSRAHLKRALKGRSPLSWVFSGPTGSPLGARQARRRLALWAGRAGIAQPVGPHTLRHTFAMALYGRTGDLLVVQRALAHGHLASTMCYARANDQRVRAALT